MWFILHKLLKTKKTFFEFFQDGQITLDNPISAQDQDKYLDVEIVYSFSGLDFFYNL
jgi:hypothetical protein